MGVSPWAYQGHRVVQARKVVVEAWVETYRRPHRNACLQSTIVGRRLGPSVFRALTVGASNVSAMIEVGIGGTDPSIQPGLTRSNITKRVTNPLREGIESSTIGRPVRGLRHWRDLRRR